MANYPPEAEYLCLEPPFYQVSALASAGISETLISVSDFGDDAQAAVLNVALRSSIERALSDDLPAT